MIGSIVIPYKAGNSFRERNLLFTIEYYLKNFPDIEVILSEQNGDSEISNALSTKYGGRFFHYNHIIIDEYFCKSKLINLGVLSSNSDLLMMIDGDVILPVNSIYKAFDYCKNETCSVYQPFSYINYLTESQTRQYIREGIVTQYKTSEIMPIQKYTGGVNVFSKKTFQFVNGFDEYISGWGSEDDSFLAKIKRMIGPIHWCDEQVTLLHLWHPKSNTNEYLSTPRYISNRKASACIQRMTMSELNDYTSNIDPVNYLRNKIDEYEKKGLLHLMCKIPVSNTFISIDCTVYPVLFNSNGIGTFSNFCEVFVAESSPDDLINTLRRFPNIYNNLTYDDNQILNKYIAM